MKALIYISCLFLFLGYKPLFGQCEDLKGWSDPELEEFLEFGPTKWQDAFYDYFSSDSSTRLIKADSVLISYLSHPENQTNYGLPCGYVLATKHAEIELEILIKSLYINLGKVDSANFSKSQTTWKQHYRNERDFINHAFVGYSNYSKYGHGREIMIDNAAKIYGQIKARIMDVLYYIEKSDFFEKTNDE